MRRSSYKIEHQLGQWLAHFTDYDVHPEISAKYLRYLTPLVQGRVPVIFGFRHLSDLLGLKPGTLAKIINCPSAFYREFAIPKRSGGKRPIHAPYPTLLSCQRWVLENILSKINISPASHAYREGRSILTNAKPHLGSDAILKMDFKDFFPSIQRERVIALFLGIGYSPKVSYYLSQLCCLDGVLPQGSATSPALSNIMCRSFDHRVMALARKLELFYTRYADDLTISGSRDRLKISGIISRIAAEEGFTTNDIKTRLIVSGTKMIVTGLDISSGKVRPTREFRRRIETEVFYIWRHGLIGHINNQKVRDPGYVFQLQGRINFWRQIEPDHPRLTLVTDRFNSSASAYL